MLLGTYIKLVPCGGVGLQVVIRRSTAEATSQFVMLALNQVLLQTDHELKDSVNSLFYNVSVFLCVRVLSPFPSAGQEL